MFFGTFISYKEMICFYCLGCTHVYWRVLLFLGLQDVVLLEEGPQAGHQPVRPPEIQPPCVGHSGSMRSCWHLHDVPGPHLDLRRQLPDAERECDHLHGYPVSGLPA